MTNGRRPRLLATPACLLFGGVAMQEIHYLLDELLNDPTVRVLTRTAVHLARRALNVAIARRRRRRVDTAHIERSAEPRRCDVHVETCQDRPVC